MHTPRKPIRLSLGTEPPVEFRLFPLGTVETTKGTFLLTPEDAAACVKRHVEYGNELSIDYGHGVFQEADGAPQRAAGWIVGLEVRDDGLWATGVTWTPTAERMIREREQRYFSPAFMADEEGHITEILNVALTLMPATHNLTPLVASRRSGDRTPTTLTKRTSTMDETYVSAEELKKLADDLEKMAEGEDDEKSQLKAMAEKCRKMAESGETLKKLAEDAEPEKAADDKDEADKASDDEKDPEKMAEDEAKKEEAKAASRVVAAAREATGHTDPSKIVGALKALVDSKASVTTLSARVAELEAANKKAAAESQKDRVSNLVKAHAVPGSPKCKVTPAEVDALIKWGLKDEEALRAYIDAKPVIVAASHVAAPAAKPDRAALLASITPHEAAIIKASGLTLDQYVDGRLKLPA